MKIFAQRPRLLFREIVHDDADAFFGIDSDPEVHEYLRNNQVSDKVKMHEVILVLVKGITLKIEWKVENSRLII